MNGISSNLKEEIKKSKEFKHKEKFKFIIAVLITNIMVAMLCLPSGETPAPVNEKSFHSGYQMMTIPLTALVNEGTLENKEIPVSLISKDKKIIIEKAYLHEALKKDSDSPHFKIEISDADVLKASAFVDSGMVAVPYVESKKPKTLPRRGSRYEVSI